MNKGLFVITMLATLFFTSCSEFNNIIKSGDYLYRYEAAKQYVSNPADYDFKKILNW